MGENFGETAAKVIYEKEFNIAEKTAYNLTLEWLKNLNATIETTSFPNFIKALHGTILRPTPYDPAYRKRIQIVIQRISEDSIKFQVEAMLLYGSKASEEGLRIEWWNGLFSHLFKTLDDLINLPKLKFCAKCGSKLPENERLRICPYCGDELF